ncbi:MAG: hypothetical protein J7L99_04965 [Planctomycetes bacterium]|nr:hypothetical protein [Planctomycetota bacterium]
MAYDDNPAGTVTAEDDLPPQYDRSSKITPPYIAKLPGESTLLKSHRKSALARQFICIVNSSGRQDRDNKQKTREQISPRGITLYMNSIGKQCNRSLLHVAMQLPRSIFRSGRRVGTRLC